jgi:hypothetical protein
MLMSQTPQVTITNLYNGQKDVAVQPVFVIQTNMMLDTSTLKSSPEELGSDTTGITIIDDMYIESSPDTLIAFYPNNPKVFIIDEDTYLYNHDSTWANTSYWGQIEIVDDTTFNFYSLGLEHNKEYYVVVQNLQVITQGNDTLVCDTLIIGFTTQKNNFVLVGGNLGQGFVKCNDTLYFEFNRKIDSLEYYLGEIVTLSVVDSTTLDTNSFNVIEHRTQLSTETWFNNDSTTIFIKPTYPFVGDAHYAEINLQILTGDSTDNSAFHFHKANNYNISVVTDGVD